MNTLVEKIRGILALSFIFAFAAVPVLAADGASAIDTGDTAWVLISAALVMWMTPGLGLFYGGMVRNKNVLATIMQSFFIVCFVSVLWILVGYSLAFGPDHGGLIGGLDWIGFQGVGMEPSADYAKTVPHLAFACFQMMFAVITPALITGAFAERVKFSAFVLFTALWSLFVYSPAAHWVWGAGGWLGALGCLDFAGGTCIHILSGVSGLTACLYIGTRKGYGKEAMIPHNMPMTVLGAAMLWVGWFGFNAGSALGANGLAANAFAATQVAAAGAAVSWVAVEAIVHDKPTVLGGASGVVAGLVAITPAAGFVTPLAGLVIGLVAGVLCFFAVAVVKQHFGYDDSLDAFGVHGVGGLWGAIATGLFCTTMVNPDGANGLFAGNASQVGIQAIGALSCIVFGIVMTLIILKIVDALIGIRVSPEKEIVGLDVTEHGERGYVMMDSFGAMIASTNHPSVTKNKS